MTKLSLDEIVDEFSQTVGVEKARGIVEEAASKTGVGMKDEYSAEEIIDISEFIRDENTGYIRIVANDLMVRKRAEIRFEALLENIPDPATVAEFEGNRPKVIMINSAFEDVFGYTSEELVGESLNDYIVPEEFQEESKEIDKRAASKKRVEKEVTRVTKDGEHRDFLFRSIQVETLTGEIEGYRIYTDITDRKRRERELERQNEQLEQFASVVSHDLRNPLEVAIGYFDLVKDEVNSEHAEKIERAHDRMRNIIEDVLTLARQGKTVDETSSVSISDVAEEAWMMVEKHSTDTNLETDESLASFEADRKRLLQAFENLFRNSIEHGGEDIEIRVGILDEGGFYVEDDGSGIPEEEREQVFEHGYTTADQGTGFGLSIVRNVFEAHGWTIEIGESDEGGARFEVYTSTKR